MNSRFQSVLCSCAFFLISAGTVLAHEDTLIRLEETRLVGLPKSYAPAELNLKEFRLRIKDHAIDFSTLLRSFFELPYDLTISASWYHRSEILPPYILFHVRPKKKDFGYQLLFNLDTLDVIKLTVVLYKSEGTKQLLPIALSDEQKESIRKSIEKIQ